MRALTTFLMLMAGLTSAAVARTAEAAPPRLAGITAQAPARPLVPRLVMQTVSQYGVDVAAWIPGGRYPGGPHLVTASGPAREVLIWDEGRGLIIDRLRLPPVPGAALDAAILQAMTVSDRRVVRIDGLAADRAKADGLLAISYEVDLDRRAVRLLGAAPQAGSAEETFTRWGNANRRIYGDDEEMSEAEALAVLPALPPSPDGRKRLVRDYVALSVAEAGKPLRPLASNDITIDFDGAALAPDGRWLALVDSIPDETAAEDVETLIELFDVLAGRFGAGIRLPGDYDEVRWLDAGRFLAMEWSDGTLSNEGGGEALPMLVVMAETGEVRERIEARCWVQVLPGGDLLGAGLANCRDDLGKAPDRNGAVQRFDRVRGRWRDVPGFRLGRDEQVAGLAATLRGEQLAVAVRDADANVTLLVLEVSSGAEIKRLALDAGSDFTMMRFAADGRGLLVAADGGMALWRFDDETWLDIGIEALVPEMIADDGRVVLAGGALETGLSMADMADGRTLLRPPSAENVVAGGFVPGKPLFWGVSRAGELWLWETKSWSLLTTTRFFGEQTMVTLGRDGRYDTNVGPDDTRFRWLMADAPWQSLPSQTFMRDYFEPELLRKTVDCTLADSCARVLRPVRDIARLNRLLPEVRILDVQLAEDAPGQVVVDVELQETGDPRKGMTSGLFGVKLLLNDRQIEQIPGHFEQPVARDIEAWREANALVRDEQGMWRGSFQVAVPTHHGGEVMEFAAYAFNADRVKSDTARRSWTPPPPSPAMPLRPRRAFVLTIGVDDYAEKRLDLNFAVADATVIGDRLAAIPGYEMRHARLTSAPARDGKPARQVTRDDIRGALSLLAGFPPEMDQMIRLADVHGATALEETNPDDIVIISYSGHGHADASGNFVLVPSDARWPGDADGPVPQTVISAADLTIWLGFMQASEIAFIIDACHSGASVATPDFKPGPMGDSGLGQLAFDKGIRILAATQADDVALELSSLKQGLLTAALGEGLDAGGKLADGNRDGIVLLDEWLRYAVARLPSLSEEARRGNIGGAMAARGVRVVMRRPGGVAVAPRVQEPSLFDYNAAPSQVVLRGQP